MLSDTLLMLISNYSLQHLSQILLIKEFGTLDDRIVLSHKKDTNIAKDQIFYKLAYLSSKDQN